MWKFIKLNTAVIIMSEKERFTDRHCLSSISAACFKVPQFGCKFVTKAQNYIDLAFEIFEFEVVGRSFQFFGF